MKHGTEPGGLRVALEEVAPAARASVLALWERAEFEVHRSDEDVWIPKEALWKMSDGLLASLGVGRYQGTVEIAERGLAGGARYAWSLRWSGGDAPMSGCWRLPTSGPPELLDPEMAALDALVEGVAGSTKVTVFRSVIRLQALARSCPRILPPPRLASRRIREATAVRIEVDGPPDDPRPSPRLVASAPEGDGPAAMDRQGAEEDHQGGWEPPEARRETAEELDVSHVQLLDEAVARATGDSVVPVGADDFVVVPAAVYRDYLLTLAAAEQGPGVRRRFVENPTAFLPDPDVFDEAHYSTRVVGVGEAPKSGGAGPATTRTWVESNGGLLIDAPEGPLWVSDDEIAPLVAALRAAISAGTPDVSWRDQAVPALPGVVAALERAIAPNTESDEGDDPQPRPRILRIRENEVVLDWAPIRGSGRLAPLPHVPPLSAGHDLQLHQQQAMAVLQDLWTRGEPGALLCDDMGLGKTLQALVFAAWVARQVRSGGGPADGEAPTVPVMVVAPPSLLEGWLKELEARLPTDVMPKVLWGASALPEASSTREVRLLSNFRRDPARGAPSVVVEHARIDLASLTSYAPDLLLIGYDTLRSLQFAIGEMRFGLVIADEAQAVKNPGSLRSHALRAMNYDFALALTGTPIENTWADLWTICDFATPGRLGPLVDFRKEFPASEEVQAVGERLAKTLSSVLIRRTRKSALRGLPPCDVRSELRKMPAPQALAYRAEANRAGRGAILGLLQGLARISLHPRTRATLTNRDEAVAWLEESARTQVMYEALSAWAGERQASLVFVRSLAAQETLSRALRLVFDLPMVECLNGQSPLAERQRLVGRFEDGAGFRVLLVSPDVGGAGWNLQFAARTVLLERPFNPAVEAQMIARTWRLGQRQPVKVVSPVACLDDMDSFDVVLDGLLNEKRALAESVLAPAAVGEEEVATRFAGLRLGAITPAEECCGEEQ